MQAALNIVPIDNLIEVDFSRKPDRRTTSLYKSNGIPKASTADPIRELSDVHAMQAYFKKHNIRDYTMFSLGLLFGLRASDLLSLRLDHVLTSDGTFKTHCSLYEKKTRKFNNPLITPQARILLTNYIRTIDYKALSEPLFRSRNSNADGSPRPITIQQFRNVLRKAAKECNVPGNISTHSIRKTFAYHLLKANPNDDNAKFALQKMLNHSDFQTTLTYCGLTQDSVDEVRNSVNDIFLGGVM